MKDYIILLIRRTIALALALTKRSFVKTNRLSDNSEKQSRKCKRKDLLTKELQLTRKIGEKSTKTFHPIDLNL